MRETMYFWLSLYYEAKSVTYLSLMLDIILQYILTHGEAFLQMGGLVEVSLRLLWPPRTISTAAAIRGVGTANM
jgi:hypothetical protein